MKVQLGILPISPQQLQTGKEIVFKHDYLPKKLLAFQTGAGLDRSKPKTASHPCIYR